MDSQDHRKNHTPGHESHGVHLCHKCGWPFPKPHPSARHRRAHKKICGTIEGYKLNDAQAAISDDEHPSDDDLKTPSPKLLERSINERGSGGIGERSNRSEDEVFADAIAEFPDSGSNMSNEDFVDEVKRPTVDVEATGGNDSITNQSYKDAESTDTFPLPNNSNESIQVQNTEVCESILCADKQDSQDPVVVDATLSLDAITSTEKQTEEFVYDPVDAKGVSACNIELAKAETETDASKSSVNSTDGHNLRQVDAKRDGETNSGGNVLDVAVSSSDHSGTELSKVEIVTSDDASKAFQPELKKIDVVSPHPESGDAVFQSNEVYNVDYKMPSNDVFPEVGTMEVTNDSSHTAENRENAFPGMHSTASGNSVQVYNGKGEESNYMNELSVSDDIPIVNDSEIMIKGFKDHKEGKLPHFVNTDALEVIDCIKDSHAEDNSSSSQSRLCDEATAVSVSDSHGSEGYLEHKGSSNNDEAGATGVLVSNSHGSEGYLEQKGNLVEVFPSEGDIVIPQIEEIVKENKKLEEIGSSADAVAVGMEPRDIAQLPEESVLHDCYENFSLTTSPSQDTKILPDVNSVGSPIDAAIGQATNIVYVDNTGKFDEAKAERCDAADHDDSRRVTADEDMKNIITNSEPARIISECEVSARINLHTDDHVADGDDGQSEIHDTSTKAIAEIDSISKSTEENCAENKKMPPETAGENQDLQVFSENATNVPEKLAKSEFTHLVSVPDTQLTEIEHGGNKEVHLECTGVNEAAGAENPTDVKREFSKVFEDAILPQVKTAETESHLSDRILDKKEGFKEMEVKDIDKVNVESVAASIISESDIKAELPENSKKDHKTGDPTVSPLDTVSSVQSSGTFVDGHDKVSAEASSADKPQPLPDESENNFGAQQHGASVTYFSVDSSSQTDSLEGHWGSVSVLSTVSDVPAITDAEPLPSNGLQVSADRKKGSFNKEKIESEAPHSEKADVFEPPSFMTLVEPKPAEASASEMQTPQNPQQAAGMLRAGWFPSLTNVVNESQGRKKNEEIIAKVTNWSSGKQHTPLKNLLGEANVEGKPKSPNVKENPPPVETTQKDNGTLVTTVSTILGPQEPVTNPAKKDAGREWNSPARYPADIKREKRKVKGRPYWAQFVCCSSVN